MTDANRELSPAQRVLGFLGDTCREGVRKYEDEVRMDAADRQFQIDMIRFAAALAELKVDRNQMRDLMHKWFCVDSMTEADSYIREGTQVKYPLQRISEYLEHDGSDIDFTRFCIDHDVSERLRRDPNLAKLETDELISRLSNE